MPGELSISLASPCLGSLEGEVAQILHAKSLTEQSLLQLSGELDQERSMRNDVEAAKQRAEDVGGAMSWLDGTSLI